MSTINSNVTAAYGYGGVDLVAIYGQGGVKIWEAETEPEPVGPIPEWYGETEDYDFSDDYFTILPLETGNIYFKILPGNENFMLYSNTGSDSDVWDFLPWELIQSNIGGLDIYSLEVNKLEPVYIKLDVGFTLFNGKNSGMDPQYTTNIYDATCDFYARGNLDKSWADAVSSSQKLVFKSLFRGNTHLLGTKYLSFFTEGYDYNNGQDYTYEMYTCTWMFDGCTNLTTTPDILPASTLLRGCYQEMYNGCTSLTTAPILPATTLDQYVYQALFRYCSSLNHITMLATQGNTSAGCTSFWVNGVSSATGVFVRHIQSTWPTTGSGSINIPSGWRIIYYDPDDDKYYTDQTKLWECDKYGNIIS